MKIKNIVSISLALGIILNYSLPIFASIIVEDGRYETFKSDNIIVNNILEESRIDIKSEGNTLVNLATIPNESHLSTAGNGNGVNRYISKNGTYRWEKESPTGHDFYPKIILSKDSKGLIEPNKTYTIQYKIKSSQNIDSGFCIANGDAWLGNQSDDISLINMIGKHRKEVVVKEVFTTNTPKNPLNELSIGFSQVRENYNNTVFPQWVEISDLIIISGDYGNKDIPRYFEGIQSSFEDNIITQKMVNQGKEKAENIGKYKIEYKTVGRNKFNSSYSAKFTQGTIYAGLASNNYFTINNIKEIAGNSSKLYWYPLDEENNILPFTVNYCLRLFDKNNFSQPLTWRISREELDVSMLQSNNTYYMDIYYNGKDLGLVNGESYVISNIMITTEPIEKYEPYKEQIDVLYLNSPLLEGDTIEHINGQAYHVKRRKKIVLDGKDEDWLLDAKEFNLRISDKKHSSYVYSDKFRFAQTNYKRYPENNNCILMGSDDYYGVLIRKDEMNTVDEFKQWLSENPVTLVYELAEPIYESIETNLSVQLFEGSTHISNNSNIPTIMEITVDRVANRAKEYSELAKENPTIENISLARMWTNLMRESILKDEFQNNVDSITEIIDMTLEKQTISSNVDLYIKSENMLSMSLNTNSITFEDFSGAEDLIKDNAVSITINSSLPYQLNAYLPTEISNSDKSNIMDLEILNIKESSKTDYQTFNNINEKLILKDNNLAGNDLVHNICFKLKGGIAHEKDIYKTIIKFEAEQK